MTDFSFVGAWLRSRSGPTRGGGMESIGTWHLVEGVINGWGVQHPCRVSARSPYPQMGHRWEIAFQPYGFDGQVCQKCARTAGWVMSPSDRPSFLPHTGCRKCGRGYVINPVYDPSCALRGSEHLHWACPGCGFNWTSDTADQEMAS